MTEGFIFYKSFADALEPLPAEQYKMIVTAICKYAIEDIYPEGLDAISMAIFTLIKPQIDANKKRRENGKRGAEYGALGGRPRKSNANETAQKPQKNPTETPKEKVKDKVNVKVNVKSSFADLSPELTKAVQEFVEHRKVLRKPMSDRAVDLFIKRLMPMASTDAERIELINTAIERGWQTVYPESTHQQYKKPNAFNNFEKHDYDFAGIERQIEQQMLHGSQHLTIRGE